MSRTGTGRAVDGLGSGVVAGPRGHVLTSAHVVAGARALRVRFHDGSEADAVLVAADRATDVAVLRIRSDDGVIDAMRPIRFGDPERLRVGEWVVAIGSPYGLSETVTTGVVSAKGRRRTGANGFGGLIQTDAALNPGSSGGALVDLQGRLVGINTARVARLARVPRAGGEDGRGGNDRLRGDLGIGFAVPADLARKVMEDLIRDGHVTRGWLGVSVADAARGGSRVEGVARGGPADKAGIRRGDVIAALDGRNVEDTDDLLGRVGMARPGSTLALEVLRSGKRMEMEVRLGRRAPPPSSRGGGGIPADGEGHAGAGPRLGMGVAKADAALRKRYGLEKDDDGLLVVTSLDKDGGARAAGLRAGDLILEADGREVSDADDLRAAAAAARKSGDGTVTLRVRRDGEAFSVDVRIGPGSA
jgi:S1-C subfamily serine protease